MRFCGPGRKWCGKICIDASHECRIAKGNNILHKDKNMRKLRVRKQMFRNFGENANVYVTKDKSQHLHLIKKSKRIFSYEFAENEDSEKYERRKRRNKTLRNLAIGATAAAGLGAGHIGLRHRAKTRREARQNNVIEASQRARQSLSEGKINKKQAQAMVNTARADNRNQMADENIVDRAARNYEKIGNKIGRFTKNAVGNKKVTESNRNTSPTSNKETNTPNKSSENSSVSPNTSGKITQNDSNKNEDTRQKQQRVQPKIDNNPIPAANRKKREDIQKDAQEIKQRTKSKLQNKLDQDVVTASNRKRGYGLGMLSAALRKRGFKRAAQSTQNLKSGLQNLHKKATKAAASPSVSESVSRGAAASKNALDSSVNVAKSATRQVKRGGKFIKNQLNRLGAKIANRKLDKEDRRRQDAQNLNTGYREDS